MSSVSPASAAASAMPLPDSAVPASPSAMRSAAAGAMRNAERDFKHVARPMDTRSAGVVSPARDLGGSPGIRERKEHKENAEQQSVEAALVEAAGTKEKECSAGFKKALLCVAALVLVVALMIFTGGLSATIGFSFIKVPLALLGPMTFGFACGGIVEYYVASSAYKVKKERLEKVALYLQDVEFCQYLHSLKEKIKTEGEQELRDQMVAHRIALKEEHLDPDLPGVNDEEELNPCDFDEIVKYLHLDDDGPVSIAEMWELKMQIREAEASGSDAESLKRRLKKKERALYDRYLDGYSSQVHANWQSARSGAGSGA